MEEKPPENHKHWYVVKVQSGREDTIKEAIERRVRKERLEEFYGQIVIPVEKVTEVKTDKNGKRVTRTKERKLYPGYLMCEVEYNDRILYLFRETSGWEISSGAAGQPRPPADADVGPRDPADARADARSGGSSHRRRRRRSSWKRASGCGWWTAPSTAWKGSSRRSWSR